MKKRINYVIRSETLYKCFSSGLESDLYSGPCSVDSGVLKPEYTNILKQMFVCKPTLEFLEEMKKEVTSKLLTSGKFEFRDCVLKFLIITNKGCVRNSKLWMEI